MMRTAWSVLTIVTLVVAAGCAPASVPPEQAQVTLTNTRVNRDNGEDNFLVDFKFTRGRPVKGKLYRLVFISGSDEKYWIDEYLTEKERSGTIEGRMRFFDAAREPSRYFEAHLELLVSRSEWKTISNTVKFGTPAAGDVVGGDGEPDRLPPRSKAAQVATAPPAVPDIPVPLVGALPQGFPRGPGVTAAPFGELRSSPDSASATPAPPQPASLVSVTGTDTTLAGGKGGVPFRASDADGRIAIGFRHAAGSWAGQPALRTFEPLYDRSASVRTGEALARDGYAVGGLNVDAGEYVHAVQVVFMRVTASGRLDPADSYTSEWLGTKTDKPITSLDGSGAPVLGLHGRRGAVLDAIGLVLKP